MDKRVEVATNRINIESNQMNLVGIKNSLKPTLQAFAELTNNALAGVTTSPAAPSRQACLLPADTATCCPRSFSGTIRITRPACR